jgi:hypothetical protein
MLRVIDLSINLLVDEKSKPFTSKDRLEHFISLNKKRSQKKSIVLFLKISQWLQQAEI